MPESTCIWERLGDMLHRDYLQVDSRNNVRVHLPNDEGYAWRIVRYFPKRGANAYGVWATDDLGLHLFINTCAKEA
jgi:hypothetical protein